MRAALIPPKGYFHTALRSDYHLALAQIRDPEYTALYANRKSSHYLILDNGAAEGEPVRDSTLVARAEQLGADEIVVPDVMGDASATVERARQFLEIKDDLRRYKLMGVVQSQGSLGEVIRCIQAFDEMPITTLGIPRHLVDKDKYFRYNVLNYLRGFNYDKRFEVHLLGTNPKWPAEICTIADIHPWVRGVDTSLPYNYAIAGKRLDGKNVPSGSEIRRPEAYFDKKQDIEFAILAENINTYLRWARGASASD